MSQTNAALQYDANDQMIVSAAKLIRNGEAAYVGVGLPMVAALLAKRTHAPDCTVVIENGIIRTEEFELPAGTDTLGTQFHADKLGGLTISVLGSPPLHQPGFHRRRPDRPIWKCQRYGHRDYRIRSTASRAAAEATT